MKKTLIALAALAATGAAFAQSSVTLYGIADLVLHKDKGAQVSLTSGGVSGSRWGIKGTEDLGGGLKAGFNFEQGVGVDTGAASGFTRKALISLSGGFGQVKLGRMNTAYDDVAAASDPVFDASVLGPINLVFFGHAGRTDNTIYYATPEFSGFSGAVSVGLDEAPGSNDTVAFHVKYANGPLSAALGYQDQKADGLKFTNLNGSYDFGMAKLLLTYNKVNAAGSSPDTDEYAIGADIPLASNIVASVGYGSSKTDGASSAKVFSAGVAYLLSKRTTLYAGFADANGAATNKNLASYRKNAPDSRFGVGLKHTF